MSISCVFETVLAAETAVVVVDAQVRASICACVL